MKPPSKVLFILKRRHDYNAEKHSNIKLSTGLYNSAEYMNTMLNDSGIKSNIVVVTDNNDIDREVTKHKPSHVVIEALWVVPTKFQVLCKLHPNVKWIVRLHSEIPFLANEGNAMDWITDYVEFDNVSVAVNSLNTLGDIRSYIKAKYDWSNKKVKSKIIYLPNFYPQHYKIKEFNRDKHTIDVACFGAVRPLKNHLIQALAAIKFANKINKKLRFHINAGRVEQKGESVLKNLISVFTHLHNSDYTLVNHGWLPREEFLEVCEKMDIGMQVSLTETFNIVAADLIASGIPVVGSNEIPWISRLFSTARPTRLNNIYYKLLLTYYFSKINVFVNQFSLYLYTNQTRKIWVNYFKNQKNEKN
jgi:hypothetical protein